jgi:hypothetical protein
LVICGRGKAVSDWLPKKDPGMRGFVLVCVSAVLLGGALPSALAQASGSGLPIIEDFTMQPETGAARLMRTRLSFRGRAIS